MGVCAFCKNEATADELPTLSYSTLYDCPCCGKYLLDRSFGDADKSPDEKFKIACVLNERRLKKLPGIAIDKTTDLDNKVLDLPRVSLDDILNDFPKKASEYINRAILNLNRLSEPYDLIQLDMTAKSDYLLLFKKDQKSAYTFLKELERKGLISFNIVSGGPQLNRFSLTTESYELVKNLQELGVDYNDQVQPNGQSQKNETETLNSCERLNEYEGGSSERKNKKSIKKRNQKFMYPWQKRETVTSDYMNQTQYYFLNEIDLKIIQKWIPKATVACPYVNEIEGVLITKCGISPEQTPKMSWPQILETLKQTDPMPHDSIKSGNINTAESKDGKTKYEHIIEWCKNNWLICVLLIVFAIVIGFGAFTDAIDKIQNYWLKPKLPAKQENPTKFTETSISDEDRITQLRPRIKKRVDDLYDKIDNEKLKPWVFINAGVPVKVTKCDGSVISCEGVMFTGTPRNVFWSDDFMPPIIEDAIIKAFDQTIEECRTNGIDSKPQLFETNLILSDFIYRIYNRMASIDSKLMSKDTSENVQHRKDVTDEISKMKQCLKRHYDAALLLVSNEESIKVSYYAAPSGREDGGAVLLPQGVALGYGILHLRCGERWGGCSLNPVRWAGLKYSGLSGRKEWWATGPPYMFQGCFLRDLIYDYTSGKAVGCWGDRCCYGGGV